MDAANQTTQDEWQTFLAAAGFSAERAAQLAPNFFREGVSISGMAQLYGRVDCLSATALAFQNHIGRLGIPSIGEEIKIRNALCAQTSRPPTRMEIDGQEVQHFCRDFPASAPLAERLEQDLCFYVLVNGGTERACVSVIGKRHAVTNKHIIDLVWPRGRDRLAEAATSTEEGLLIGSEMHAPLVGAKSVKSTQTHKYIPPMKREEQATKKQQTIVTAKFIVPNVIVPITIYNQANRGFKCEIIVYSPSPYDDYVVLRTLPGEADLCNDAPTLENARKGIEYLMMGYQKTTVSNDTLCVLKGIIVSAKLYNLKNTIIGSPGARPRFSGGIVASRCTGYVIGICRRPPPMGFNMGPYVGNTDLAEYVEIINIALIVSAIHYHVAIKRLDALTYVV